MDFAASEAVVGNYAYVSDLLSGLQVIDISDPTSPELVGAVNTPGRALGVAVLGNYAYVADVESGLQVIDVSTPTSVRIVGAMDTPGFAFAVAVAGNHAYVADQFSGLQVIDISNPLSPEHAGSVNTPGNALGVTNTRTGRIQINGGVWQNITFDPTGSWMTWVIKEFSATLNSGTNNTIRLESTGEDLPILDEMDVVLPIPDTTPPTAPTWR